MLLAILYCALLAAWYLLGLSPAGGWWPYRLASLFAIWLFLPLPALLLYAAWRRRWQAMALLTLPLALLAVQYGYLLLPRQAAASGVPLRVMTANLLSSNAEVGALGVAIAKEHPDLLAVQELNPDLAKGLAAQVGREFPYVLLYPDESYPTLGLYSRFPLAASAVSDNGGDGCPCQQATADVNGRAVTVLNVHPPRPTLGFRRIGPVPVPTTFDTARRDRALGAIVARAQTIAGPLIVLGDFNTSDRDPAYGMLAGTLDDAFRAAGWGPGYTFPSRSSFDGWPSQGGGIEIFYLPVVRIDYVFTSPGWTPTGAQVVNVPGSDHLSVVADLALTGGGSAQRPASGPASPAGP
ncbi:MAG: endonuclease/exonuclease/phosphatase family protein [Dehalococcoidales bacterium]|nr:endonuclease/exonuclease/phosphatase family protein [Dehalococcoidales bacterium]